MTSSIYQTAARVGLIKHGGAGFGPARGGELIHQLGRRVGLGGQTFLSRPDVQAARRAKWGARGNTELVKKLEGQQLARRGPSYWNPDNLPV